MSLSAAEIEAMIRDLRPRLEGGRIERIDQPDRHKLVLSVRNDRARYWLLICVHPQFSRIHLLTKRPEHGKPAAGFCNVVRQHLTGGLIATLRQTPGDRVIFLECLRRDRLMHRRRVTLAAELVGVASNLLILDEGDRVVGTLFREQSARRTIVPGVEYQPLKPPAGPPQKARLNRFEGAAQEDDALALSRAIQTHYARLEADDALESRRAALLSAIKRALKTTRTRLRKVQTAFNRTQDAETMRRKGELLKIALPQIHKGQREVQVEDLFDPAGPMLTIELDPLLSPEQNVEGLFKRYKKAKAGCAALAARLEETHRTLEAIGPLEGLAAAATSPEALREAEEKAQAMGVLLSVPGGRRPAEVRGGGPRCFRSADGFEILVARNRRENDRLTFGIARGNDHWLHVVGWPGPHVIIRKPPDRDVSQAALLDAAHLAVHFSKIRGTDYAEVTHTQCKHVHRLKGSPPGTVSYARASTLQVRVEPARLERLLKTPSDSTRPAQPPG